MSKPDSWMPLYWADFLADTLHLDRAEIGSYMLLIGAYWRRGGPLPDDNEHLRMICRCDPPQWARCKGTMASFFTIAGGTWTHKRIDEELKEAQHIYSAKSKAGKVGAAKRWQKDSTAAGKHDGKPDGIRMAEPLANASQNDAQPQPQPQPQLQPQPPTPTKTTKLPALTAAQRDIAKAFEAALGDEWPNDAGKWITRIKTQFIKTQRVLGELVSASKEQRVKTTPAAFAEDTWKRFTPSANGEIVAGKESKNETRNRFNDLQTIAKKSEITIDVAAT